LEICLQTDTQTHKPVRHNIPLLYTVIIFITYDYFYRKYSDSKDTVNIVTREIPKQKITV